MTVPALDGSAFVNGVTSTTTATTSALTTTAAGKVMVSVLCNAANVSSIAGASLTFSLVARNSPTGTNRKELWQADSTGVIDAQTITVTLDVSSAYCTVVAFGVKDENGFDADASTPATNFNTDASLVIDTASANTFVIGAYRCSTGTPAAPSGWSTIHSGGFLGVWYKTFTSAQTALTVDKGSSTINGGVADALVGSALLAVPPYVSVTVSG